VETAAFCHATGTKGAIALTAHRAIPGSSVHQPGASSIQELTAERAVAQASAEQMPVEQVSEVQEPVVTL
jgi:hypothetical protein